MLEKRPKGPGDSVPPAACAHAMTVALICIALVGMWSFYRERLVPRGADRERAMWLLTGDEPAYLLAAQAIAAGEGLDLGPAHRRGDHLRFWRRDIIGEGQYTWAHYRARGLPYVWDRSRWWGDKQIKHHMPLLPVFLAPIAYRTNPRWAAAVLQSLLFAFAVALVLYHWLPREPSPRWSAAVAVLALLGGLPVGYYTAQIFPEILATTLLLLGLVLLDRPRAASQALGWFTVLAAPWATPRVTGGVFAAALYGAVRHARRREYGRACLPIAGLAAYFAYHLWVWGWFFPPAYDEANRAALRLLPSGLVRIFLENHIGLFFLNPMTICGLVAVGLWWARGRPSPLRTVWTVIWLGTLAAVAMLPQLRAGTCPAGRYQVIPAALLIVPVLRIFETDPSPALRRLSWMIAIWFVPALVIAYFVGRQPNYWFARYHPLFAYPALRPWYRWLPRFDSWRFWVKAGLWTLVLAVPLILPDLGRRLASWRGRRTAATRAAGGRGGGSGQTR